MPKEFDLSKLSVPELEELLRRINELLPYTAEREWKDRAKKLEDEALEAIQELNEFTGRNYRLTLGGYIVQRKSLASK